MQLDFHFCLVAKVLFERADFGGLGLWREKLCTIQKAQNVNLRVHISNCFAVVQIYDIIMTRFSYHSVDFVCQVLVLLLTSTCAWLSSAWPWLGIVTLMLVINTDSCTTPSLDAQALHLLTHSLNATIDQLRVVVSSTLTDPWPRSGPSSRVAPVLLQLVGAMDDVVCQVGN